VRVDMRRKAVLNERYVCAGEEGVDSAHIIPERSRLGGLLVVDAVGALCSPRPTRQREDLLALIPSEIRERDPEVSHF